MNETQTPLNLQDAAQVTDLFLRAAEANTATGSRHGSLIELSDTGRLLVTGDLHDHREHFEKSVKLARLNYSDNYHLVLQEIIHGERLVNGMDLSYRIMARAAELKLHRPEQVHHLLSNHELAQALGEGLLKDSVSVVDAFDEGLGYVFGGDAERVASAIDTYVKSLPLAVRCANGLFIAHSLPGVRQRDKFDPEVVHRALTDADYARPDGSAYLMVWGRGLTQKLADDLAEHWRVEVFILGHQPAEMGHETYGDNVLVINSDHSHGVALPVDLSINYERDDLVHELLPLIAV